MTQVIAKLRYLQMAPRKVRMVAQLIRGKGVKEALLQLERLPKRASLPLKKLLASGIASAAHDFHLSETGLYISELRVDGGPMAKRTFPRSRGRADIKRKRTSHITLILEEKPGISDVNAKSPKKLKAKS